VLDGHHVFPTGKVTPVCGNTFAMLQATRLQPHFDFIGDKTRHFGIFPDCGVPMPFTGGGESSGALSVAPSATSSGACC